jgi:hypothetical protein
MTAPKPEAPTLDAALLAKVEGGGVMPTFNFDLDFEVYCGGCGAGLCNDSDTRESRKRNFPQVVVNPCSVCLESAREEGREEAQKAMEAA